MKRLIIFLLAVSLVLSGCQRATANPIANPTATKIESASTQPPKSTPAPPIGGTSPFGVLVSAGRRPDIVQYVTDLGASWVRVNVFLDGDDADIQQFLAANVNVVISIAYRNQANIDTRFGSISEWPNGGFPYKSREVYQQQIRDMLTPLLPYLAQGRQIWVQAENEVGDAALSPNGKYWRGDMDQYLDQLSALYEAVKSVGDSIPVVLSSFTSDGLDRALNPSDSQSVYAVKRMQRLLSEGKYDAADLHFYGCVEDIPAKVAWVKANMPADKIWISTENGGPDYRCASTPHHWDENPAIYEQKQAAQVASRLNACRDNGGAICLWFSLFDLKNEADVFTHMGLLDPRQTPPVKKPAYQAFKNFISENR